MRPEDAGLVVNKNDGHDTTLTASVQTAGYLEDSHVLHGDAGNLAAFLYRLQQAEPACYQRIRSTVRMATSFLTTSTLPRVPSIRGGFC